MPRFTLIALSLIPLIACDKLPGLPGDSGVDSGIDSGDPGLACAVDLTNQAQLDQIADGVEALTRAMYDVQNYTSYVSTHQVTFCGTEAVTDDPITGGREGSVDIDAGASGCTDSRSLLIAGALQIDWELPDHASGTSLLNAQDFSIAGEGLDGAMRGSELHAYDPGLGGDQGYETNNLDFEGYVTLTDPGFNALFPGDARGTALVESWNERRRVELSDPSDSSRDLLVDWDVGYDLGTLGNDPTTGSILIQTGCQSVTADPTLDTAPDDGCVPVVDDQGVEIAGLEFCAWWAIN